MMNNISNRKVLQLENSGTSPLYIISFSCYRYATCPLKPNLFITKESVTDTHILYVSIQSYRKMDIEGG